VEKPAREGVDFFVESHKIQLDDRFIVSHAVSQASDIIKFPRNISSLQAFGRLKDRFQMLPKVVLVAIKHGCPKAEAHFGNHVTTRFAWS